MGPRLDTLRDQHRRRLDRQLELITKWVPFLSRPLKVVLRPSMWVLRVPLALVLICGGLLGFLPVLGFWMLPLGALLLAVDFTPIRPAVAGGVVRGRRKVSLWRRAWTAWRYGPPKLPGKADESLSGQAASTDPWVAPSAAKTSEPSAARMDAESGPQPPPTPPSKDDAR